MPSVRNTTVAVALTGNGAWRYWLLVGLTVLSLPAMFWLDPIPQDPAYHHFADQRGWLGIPNWQNVLSNLPFLFVGAAGLAQLRGNAGTRSGFSWGVFFLGVALTCFGSMYYHWRPDNETLVWDRLPMTMGFMGIFIALLGEYVDPRAERMLLPALALGAFSVLYWWQVDDLRLYIWVQAVPMLTIVLVLLLFEARYTHRRFLAYGLACYVLAKLFEFTDHTVFSATGELIGGHALKHLAAALGAWFICDMLRRRFPLPDAYPPR